MGKCARVDIGDILMSIRCRPDHLNYAQEALRRAKFKFSGRQTVFVSKKFGFTSLEKREFNKLQAEGKLIPNGVDVQVITNRGPLNRLSIFK